MSANTLPTARHTRKQSAETPRTIIFNRPITELESGQQEQVKQWLQHKTLNQFTEADQIRKSFFEAGIVLVEPMRGHVVWHSIESRGRRQNSPKLARVHGKVAARTLDS